MNENENKQEATTNEQEAKKIVYVVDGAGTEPIEVDWEENMTVTAALKGAGIDELNQGETPVIGETLIKDPDTTIVQPGQMIVIDSMPANG